MLEVLETKASWLCNICTDQNTSKKNRKRRNELLVFSLSKISEQSLVPTTGAFNSLAYWGLGSGEGT